MNTIKFNNAEFEVESYSKMTSFSNGNMSGNASCALNTEDITAVMNLAKSPITSIQIEHDGDLIYNLQNINARLDTTNEYLATDRVNINLNLIFDNQESNVIE